MHAACPAAAHSSQRPAHALACGCQCISFMSVCPLCTNSSCGGRFSGASALLSGASAASSSAKARAGGGGSVMRRSTAIQAGLPPAPTLHGPNPTTQPRQTLSLSLSAKAAPAPTRVSLQRQVPHRQLVVCRGGGKHGGLVGAPLHARHRAAARRVQDDRECGLSTSSSYRRGTCW